MQLLHEPNPTMSPKRPPVPSRGLGRSLVAGVVVAASLAVTGCGSSGSPTILNTEKVERAIEHSSLAQRGKRAQVSCPSGVHQKKGLVFSCTAVVGRDSTRFAVSQLDASGHLHYEAR
jgi:hypothetical protein